MAWKLFKLLRNVTLAGAPSLGEAVPMYMNNTKGLYVHDGTSWKPQWSPNTDGNGGQPPAPKPTATTEVLGTVLSLNSSTLTGNVYGNGTQTTDGDGSRLYFVVGSNYNTSGAMSASKFGLYAGNTVLWSTASGERNHVVAWRVL